MLFDRSQDSVAACQCRYGGDIVYVASSAGAWACQGGAMSETGLRQQLCWTWSAWHQDGTAPPRYLRCLLDIAILSDKPYPVPSSFPLGGPIPGSSANLPSSCLSLAPGRNSGALSRTFHMLSPRSSRAFCGSDTQVQATDKCRNGRRRKTGNPSHISNLGRLGRNSVDGAVTCYLSQRRQMSEPRK